MMADQSNPSHTVSAIPPDDPTRTLSLVNADQSTVRHISLVGDTYTILLSGDQTGGRYCLIDMHVPPGGGPPPHRHDFEEMFTVIDGEIEVVFRGEPYTARAGSTVNIPANAPHHFKNKSDQPARMLCMCTPAGQEAFFTAFGHQVAGRTSPPPRVSREEQAAQMKLALELAPAYRTEFLLS
jgi:quercetin dioxygenase-like cupin family protein